MSPMTGANKPAHPEVLEVRLSANASPKRVAEVATMLHEVLANLNIGDDAAEITLVVKNRATRAELRGWDDVGRAAVRDVAAIVANPTRAIQEDGRRAAAARTFAAHGRKLAPYNPTFRKDNTEIAKVDPVFIDSMEAVGTASLSESSTGTIVGDSYEFVTILRVGRLTENKPLFARMRIDGAPREVEVPESLSKHFYAAAERGDVVRVHLMCEWRRDDAGTLKFSGARAVSIDRFHAWSGADLLKDVADSPLPFTRSDFENALRSIRGED